MGEQRNQMKLFCVCEAEHLKGLQTHPRNNSGFLNELQVVLRRSKGSAELTYPHTGPILCETEQSQVIPYLASDNNFVHPYNPPSVS